MKKSKNKDYLDIDGAIKKFRKKNPDVEMSRKILAEELGLTYQSLTNYQGGKIPKSFKDLRKIEKRLGCKFGKIYKSKK